MEYSDKLATVLGVAPTLEGFASLDQDVILAEQNKAGDLSVQGLVRIPEEG